MFDVHTDQNTHNQITSKVIVTDIKMPFGSMVTFMVKAALASIPAAIIVTIIVGIVWAVIIGMLMGGSHTSR